VREASPQHVGAEGHHREGHRHLDAPAHRPVSTVKAEVEEKPGSEQDREQAHEGEREAHSGQSYNRAFVRVLIVGCGRVGSRLAADMSAEGHEVTIVDRNQRQFDLFATRGVLGPAFKGNFVIGDGCDSELLKRAGVEGADAFIAVTEGDNRNIMASEIAHHVFKVPRVVCRLYDPAREDAFKNSGIHFYCPTLVGAAAIHKLVEE